ncbi:hypothetical protein GBAR_LOCUS5518 [Geodia barretti]|uniref:Uncharacterized protein n=1 Tax=Geodia barretti TaxID=519541 RepID=A0AA35W8H5_GEOBA|nr:hypothetical protein GBAR_LOCUS5518 [Geodia barretti]
MPSAVPANWCRSATSRSPRNTRCSENPRFGPDSGLPF